jgi:hypothetical protein
MFLLSEPTKRSYTGNCPAFGFKVTSIVRSTKRDIFSLERLKVMLVVNKRTIFLENGCLLGCCADYVGKVNYTTTYIRPALGPTQPPIQWVLGALSPGLKSGRGVMLTAHPLLVPRLRKSRSYTPVNQMRLYGA